MVVSFEILPCHVQHKISEKMNFWDFKEFEVSSQCGKQIGKLVSDKVSLDAEKVQLKMAVEIAFYCPKSCKNTRRTLSELCNIPLLPRIAVSEITVFNDAILDDLLSIAQNGHFVINNLLVKWFSHKCSSPSSFERMFELLNVRSFTLVACISPDLLRFPKFFELESICHSGRIPDDIFLQFKAHSIQIRELDTSPKVGPTLNRFFKQWYSNDRKIHRFELSRSHFAAPLEEVEPEILFSSLPFSVLWTKETHDNSILSHIPRSNIGGQFEDQNVYLIQSESRKLIVILRTGRIVAYEVADEKGELLQLLHVSNTGDVYPKQTY